MVIKAALLLVAAVSCATTVQAFTVFPFGSPWKYDASGDLGTSWTATTFDDSGWLSGEGQFGFGDGDETTLVTSDTLTQYYRKTVNMPETRGWVSATISVIHDDGAVVYVNGVEVGRANMPDGEIVYGTPSVDALSGAQESTPTVISVPDSAFIFGDNVIAVSVHNYRAASSDLSFDLQFDAEAAPSPSPPPPTTISETAIARESTWKYLDDGTDLAGSSWTTLVYDDSAWASGAGAFGYGDTVATEVARNGLTVYFRTTFLVEFTARVVSGTIAARRDDGAVCYVNGAEVLRSNMPAGEINAATTAVSGISGADESRYFGGFTFDNTILQAGQNLLACEVHQQSEASSDLGFDADLTMELLIDFDAPTPSPSPAASPAAAASATSSPAASAAASTSPSRSPTPTSSLPAGVTPSNTPTPTSSLPAGVTPSNTPAPSASSSPAAANAGCGTVCSCACLTACASDDPLITACSNASSSSSSNLGVAIGSVVAVLAVIGAVAGFVWWKKNKEEGKQKGKGKGKAPQLMLTNMTDLEAGGDKHKKHKKHKKDREDRKDKDRHRSKSRRHKDDDDDKKSRSKSKHRDGDDKKSRDRKDKDRKDRDRKDKDRHRSKSRRHKDDDDKKSRSKSRHKDDRKSRDKSGDRNSRSGKRSASPTSKSKRKSKSPSKEGTSPRHWY